LQKAFLPGAPQRHPPHPGQRHRRGLRGPRPAGPRVRGDHGRQLPGSRRPPDTPPSAHAARILHPTNTARAPGPPHNENPRACGTRCDPESPSAGAATRAAHTSTPPWHHIGPHDPRGGCASRRNRLDQSPFPPQTHYGSRYAPVTHPNPGAAAVPSTNPLQRPPRSTTVTGLPSRTAAVVPRHPRSRSSRRPLNTTAP